jgi:hypothetical protein
MACGDGIAQCNALAVDCRFRREPSVAHEVLRASGVLGCVGCSQPSVPFTAIVAMEEHVIAQIAYGAKRPHVEQRRTCDRKQLQRRPEPYPTVGPIAMAIEHADVDIRGV